MGGYTWICPTELDRERLVATVHGVGRARAIMFVVLAGVAAGSARDTGWWPFVVLLGSAVGSIYLYRDLARRRRPEYWAVAGWLVTQVPLAVGIAITGGPRSPALSWLAIAVVSLVARFNRLTIRVGMCFLGLVLFAVTFAADPAWTLAHSIGKFSSVKVRRAPLKHSMARRKFSERSRGSAAGSSDHAAPKPPCVRAHG